MESTLETLDKQVIAIIITGIIMGTLARLINLRVESRQVPSYPSAYFNNIILGVIASALGAIAIPAILASDLAAVTFLLLAVQHFRDIRKIELESYTELEHTEYVKRGKAYIDGLAKTFESRNYISLVTAFITVLVMEIINSPIFFVNIAVGIITGFIVIYVCSRFIKGKTIRHICSVKVGKIEVQGSELFVDGIYLTNCLGTEQIRDLFMREGIAVVLVPQDPVKRITLENAGQRQAILYEAVRALGLKRFGLSFMRRAFESGKVIIAFVPIINEPDRLINAINKTPILENSRKIDRMMKTDFGG